MKAIIPVAGIGSRLRPHTHTQPKALVPVAGKPILGHIIDSLSEVGIKDFIFVIGYLGDKIQSYITEKYPHLNHEFVVQAQKEGIGQDKYKELQKNIESIQSMQQVDDGVIQDLVAQIKSAESAAAEIGQTKKELSQQLSKTTKDALDQVEQMKQDLARLNQVTAQVQTTVADAIPAKLDSISTKVAELEAENEDQFNELTKHEDWLAAVAPNAEPKNAGALAPARNQFNLPGVPAATAGNQLDLPGVNTTPAPINPAAAKIAQQAAQQKAKLAKAQGIDVVEPEDNLAESRFRELIKWATK
jgi:choline kinase